MRINYLYILTIALLLISCRNRSIKDVDRTVSAPQKTESLSSKIEAFVDWSKTHKSSEIKLDTISYKTSQFLTFKKDGSFLLNKLNLVSEANHKAATCSNYKDWEYVEEISVNYYKRNEFISFLYTCTSWSFHRQYDEICYTYIVLGNKVYEVTLVVTPELKKIVERAVLRFDENCRARYWAESTEYGFCIDSGKILIRPIPYSIFDEEDYCYWIDIPFSKNLKFKLTDTNEIIEEYRRIAYPEPQN